MAKLPRSLIALPVHWTVAQTGSYDVGGGAVSVTFVAANNWTRTFLAPNSGGTSEDSPRDLLRLVQAGLNAPTPGLWTVRLNSSGYVEIVYNGASPSTGTITFSTAIANALGFASTTVGPIAYSGIATATMHPAFCWLPYSLSQDTGWRSSPSHLVAARRADGLVTAWDEGIQSVERTLRADYAPTNESARTSRSLYATPYWPPDNEPSRWSAPSIAPESCPAAWTVHETLSCSPGLRVAYVIGNLQDLIAGSSSAYYVGAFDPEPLQSAEQRAVLSVGNYSSLVSVPTVRLTQAKLSTQETR